MTIPIKIQCGCGQRYAFEVEPVQGQMPYAVTCPSCGVDGTAAANELIAQSLAVAVAAPPPAVRVAPIAIAPAAPRIGPTTASPRGVRPLAGQMDRTQAKHEARAKILWGDSPQTVVGFLMGSGFPAADAAEMVDELVQERAATIRGKGVEKLVIGIMLIFVPIGGWFYFMHVGYILVKTFGFMVVAGLYGVWLVIKGLSMVFAPKSESGDAAAD